MKARYYNSRICKCKKCMEKCPQAIDIPGELEKVNAVLTGAKPIEQVFSSK